jgi:hypothetical protein
MTPKEAEKLYGKENVADMWEHINLESNNISMKHNDLNIPKYEWEKAYSIITNRKIYK